MEFKSFGGLALHMAGLHVEVAKKLQDGLERCAERIELEAKAEIGKYQAAAGPFPAWAQLEDSTEQEKARLGYPADSPLLRTGAMEGEISHSVAPLEAVVGAKDTPAGRILVYHEFGTPKMPPRPVLGPALFKSRAFIEKTIGRAAMSGLIGSDRIHPSLGYDSE
ncbi:hypothetical protein [Chromobacterium violaceum]|uniref:Phage protein, HK97 gp10 family n=1 Tax=Chromobacterium violaceum TaxID=536 RepID=A0A202B2J0_CHRVL|nr:hypothetical protein [Chromobacterium violaceum]OVE45661.1 hypothetical protein CBW21_21960 [Chromobacterium violaceum]